MEEQLVVGQVDLGLVGEDDAAGAYLERGLELQRRARGRGSAGREAGSAAARAARARGGTTHERDDLGGLGGKLVRQLLVEADEVVDVDVAVVSFQQRVLPKLVSAAGSAFWRPTSDAAACVLQAYR